MLFVESYKNTHKIPKNSIIIDTTSRSKSWTKGLSPFIIQAGYLYGNYYAKNVENAWQFSKVYPDFVDDNKNPTSEYFKWAEYGWKSNFAYRYPMGKGIKPLYSLWDGKKYDYINARKYIYIPLYSRGCVKTLAFKKLLELYKTTNKDIYLIDFDGYNHKDLNMTLTDVLNNNKKSLGHSFVIYDLLQKYKKFKI